MNARADEKTGHIRYNTTNSQFEGYGQGVWQGLGGVIDIDQDTKITADDSNNLLFDTSGSTQMTIDSNGDVSMANNLNVVGNLTLGSSPINVEDIINILDISINTLETVTTDISYSSISATTIFENNIEVQNNIIIDGSANISLDLTVGGAVDASSVTIMNNLTVGGNVDISNTIYVDVSNERIGIKNSVPEYELDVSGDIHCTGTLFADSDLNVKKNIVLLNNVLNKISKLNGYYYHKIGEEEDSLKHIGVIAQEVEKEYPELISNNTDIKSVNYDGLNAILIESVKELVKENITIKTELEEMKDRLKNIEE